MASRILQSFWSLKTLVIGIMAVLVAGLAVMLVFQLDQRTLFMPGQTSVGHYLFETSCHSCHEGFKPVSNETCLRCHEAEMATDIHGAKKFRDPRWAGELANLNALTCTTCHEEHVHMFGRGVHLKPDLCMACHSKIPQGDLKSHEGFSPDGCWTAGCHNYHDHRAISTGFLVESLGQPDYLPKPVLPKRVVEGELMVAPDPDIKPDQWEGLS